MTLAYDFAKLYEMAGNNRGKQDQVILDIKKKIKDKRVNSDNKRFLKHIVNYHARKTLGIGGHRPTVYTMKWPGTTTMNRRRKTM